MNGKIQFIKHYILQAAIMVDVAVNLGERVKMYVPIEELGDVFEAAVLDGASFHKANYICLYALADALTGHPDKMKVLSAARRKMNWSH